MSNTTLISIDKIESGIPDSRQKVLLLAGHLAELDSKYDKERCDLSSAKRDWLPFPRMKQGFKTRIEPI